jgi:hypothetical protein
MIKHLLVNAVLTVLVVSPLYMAIIIAHRTADRLRAAITGVKDVL